MSPMQMLNTARLMGCRLAGKDSGIDAQFAKAMLGMSDGAATRRCMLGCVIGWLHAGSNFVLWETGRDIVPRLPGHLLGKIQDLVGGCVASALKAQKKCSILSAVASCVVDTEKKNVVTWFQKTFMPWLPCWDFLKGAIPFVRFFDKTVASMRDSFMQQIVGAIRGDGRATFPQSSARDKPASTPAPVPTLPSPAANLTQ
ncbi:hypothetical protein ANN_17894 [Periplaneta americana]|uniref:Uncharacterized protein n=1 Tax=Periplaneta americana TaxID=6978 RepID=A0ABQ8SM81_PERAM|nr:hypothetical protein ANN_17894 [Periplaneta americana]